MRRKQFDKSKPPKSFDKTKKVDSKRRGQPRKDSSDPRVNFDNTRMSKFEKDVKGKGANDPAWYLRNPELAKSATNFALGEPLGAPLTGFEGGISIPGVYAANFVPTWGNGDNIAINQAKDSFYSFVNHANSRNTSYDASDLWLVVMAATDIFAMLANMMRAYGIAKYYTEMNLNTPDSILANMGFLPFDKNLGNVWFGLNHLIAQTAQFWVPKDIPLIKRRFWLNSNVYKDSESPKAQYYLFNQCAYCYYAEGAIDVEKYQAGALLRVPTIDQESLDLGYIKPGTYRAMFKPGLQRYSWEAWYNTAQFMINALVNSSDRGMIMADMLKAFGPERLYSLEEIPAAFKIEPVYNSEVSLQFENLNVTSTFEHLAGWVQNVSAGKLMPAFVDTVEGKEIAGGDGYEYIPAAIEQMYTPRNRILNFHETPTPEMILEATRLMTAGLTEATCAYIYSGSGPSKAEAIYDAPAEGKHFSTIEMQTPNKIRKVLIPEAIGTEVVVALYFTEYRADVNSPYKYSIGSTVLQQFKREDRMDSVLGVVLERAIANARLRSMDWSPFFYRTSYPNTIMPDSANITLTTLKSPLLVKDFIPEGEYDLYTVISTDLLKKIHTVCTFSLLGMPIGL